MMTSSAVRSKPAVRSAQITSRSTSELIASWFLYMHDRLAMRQTAFRAPTDGARQKAKSRLGLPSVIAPKLEPLPEEYVRTSSTTRKRQIAPRRIPRLQALPLYDFARRRRGLLA